MFNLDLQELQAYVPYQSVLLWAVFGLFVGILAKVIMPGRDPGGLIFTLILGIAGALLGNFLYSQLTGDALHFQDSLSLSGGVIAIIGALLLLVPFKVMFGFRRK